MTNYDTRKLAAEALGTGFLVATVVGSGIMAQRLTEDVALQLLVNTLPTGAILVVLITVLGPVSGAHFNPAVTLALRRQEKFSASSTFAYILVQIIGAILGTWVAHAMFGEAIFQVSQTVRTGASQWLAEIVATFGLVFIIIAGLKARAEAVPWLVGLYITAAYWFTASTSFANPAVAIGRAFTDSFSGIRPLDLPGFILAELIGAALALFFANWLYRKVGSDIQS
ncbi:MAG: MIP/aquaporin family protein [Pseudomonadota bacterium]